MALGRSLTFVSLVTCSLSLSFGGCDSKEEKTSRCSAGSERCACYPNATCDEGLVCLSKLCVADDGQAGAGSNIGGGANTEGGTAAVAGQSSTAAGGVVSAGQAGSGSVAGAFGASGSGSGGLGAAGANGLGGASNGFGGALPSDGGAANAGASAATGGVSLATGGVPVATGGIPASTGGTPSGTGGTLTGTGGALGTGGSAPMTLGPNQVANGDFSQGTAFWHVTTTDGYDLATGAVSSTTDPAYCVNASTTYSSQVIGWPLTSASAATLKPSTKYVFSYRIMGPATIRVDAKVGLVSTPYTAIYTAPTITLSPSWSEMRYTFTTTATQSTTARYGLAFSFYYLYSGQVCIDDVVLTEVQG